MDMNKILTLIPLAAALLLTACGSDSTSDTQTDGDAAYPIKLQLSLDDQQASTTTTRARQSTILAANDTVYAWSDYNTTKDKWFGAWRLIADGSNGLSSPDRVKYFPRDRSYIDFYAIHGKQHFDNDDNFPATGYTHTVSKNQIPDTAYLNSDLLYGSLWEVPRQTSTVRIPMYHMLSKVQVIIKSGSDALGDRYLQGATVQLVDVERSVTFTPAKVNQTDLADFDTRGNMLTLGTAKRDTVTLETAVAPNDNNGGNWRVSSSVNGDCVIPPQKLMTFIVTMPNYGVFKNMVLVADVNKELKSGYKYTFHITISPAFLKLGHITITEWDEETQDGTFDNKSIYPGTVTTEEWGNGENRTIEF